MAPRRDDADTHRAGRKIYVGAMTVDPQNYAKKSCAIFRFEDEFELGKIATRGEKPRQLFDNNRTS